MPHSGSKAAPSGAARRAGRGHRSGCGGRPRGDHGADAALQFVRARAGRRGARGAVCGGRRDRLHDCQTGRLHGLTYAKLRIGSERRGVRPGEPGGIERVVRARGPAGIDCEVMRKPNLHLRGGRRPPRPLRALRGRWLIELGLPASYVEELDLPVRRRRRRALRGPGGVPPGEVPGRDRGRAAAGRFHEDTRVTGPSSRFRVDTALRSARALRRQCRRGHAPQLIPRPRAVFARRHPERGYVRPGRMLATRPAANVPVSPSQSRIRINANGDWLLVGGESYKTGQA